MRLPGAFRRLPRPSSALKPSHSPDGVLCRAVGGVYWRLVKTFRMFLCASLFVACAWCHPESAWFCGSVYPSLRVLASMELHVDGLACFAKAVLEAVSQFISVSSGGIRVCVGLCCRKLGLCRCCVLSCGLFWCWVLRVGVVLLCS